MKKHTFGLLASAVLAILATTAFALDAQKQAGRTAQTDEACDGCCSTGCCQTK